MFGLFGNGRINNNIINLTASGHYAIIAGSGTISSNIINCVEPEQNSSTGSGITGIETETTANTTISNNIINGFGSGIYVSGILRESKVIITNNTFTNNKVGISVTATPLLLQGNNIVNSTDNAMYGSTNVNATYNCQVAAAVPSLRHSQRQGSRSCEP